MGVPAVFEALRLDGEKSFSCHHSKTLEPVSITGSSNNIKMELEYQLSELWK